MRLTALALGGVIAISSFVSAERRAELRITVQDLGLFDGSATHATAINNRGQVVGIVFGGPVSRVFLWTKATGYRLLPSDGPAMMATDINDRGQIVGFTEQCTEEFGCVQSGFMWSAAAGLQDLGSFIPLAISNKGDMAGHCTSPEHGEQSPCVRTDGRIRFVGTDPSAGEATGINARGDVVGWMYVQGDPESEGEPRAFVFTRSGQITILANAGQQETKASDINDAGISAGYVGWVDHQAAVWRRGAVITLDEWSESIAINNRGLVLASVLTNPGQPEDGEEYEPKWVPFVWNWKTGAIAEVPRISHEGSYIAVADINDRGQVAGGAETSSGERHAVIWRVRP